MIQNNIWNNCSLISYNKVNFYSLKYYKPFLILQNIKRKKHKHKDLLQNIISQTLFLVYTYVFMDKKIKPRNFKFLFNLIIDNKINFEWFKNLGKSLKSKTFNWCYEWKVKLLRDPNNKKILNIQFFKNKIVQTACYLALLQVYKSKIDFFSSHIVSFESNKNIDFFLWNFKEEWKNINQYAYFNIEKSFISLQKKNLFYLLKKNIKDLNLFLLLNQLWQIKLRKFNKISVKIKENNLLLFLFDFYLILLDKFIIKCVKQIYISKKCKKKKNNLTHQKSLFIFKKIKYLRYLNFFIVGTQKEKQKMFGLNKKIKKFIQNKLFFKICEIKIMNILKDSVLFLSYKIHRTSKKRYLFTEKEVKGKKTHVLYKNQKNKLLVKLKDKVRREYNLSFYEQFFVRNLFKKSFLRFSKKKVGHYFKENKKKFIKFCGLYWKKILNNFSLKVKWYKIYSGNNINFLNNLLLFLKTNQLKSNLSNSIILNKTLKKESLNKKYKLLIDGNLNSIYKQLRINKIIQFKKIKVETVKFLLILEEYKIIIFFLSLSKNILNYFSYCDNIINIKSIVKYYIRLSFVHTLKQKYKFTSTKKVFNLYGENLNIIYPHKNKYKLSFISKIDLKNWKLSLKKKYSFVFNYLSFKNIKRISNFFYCNKKHLLLEYKA